MPRTITCDLDSPDYSNALVALEWALHNAAQLGYLAPTSFNIALRLMKGELRVPMLSDNGKKGCFGIIYSGDDAYEDSEEIFEFWVARTKARRERDKAAKASPVEAEQAGPICVDCGGPRSVHSVAQCRACYEGAKPELATSDSGSHPEGENP